MPGDPMETMVDALRRFGSRGYTDAFQARPEGLRNLSTGDLFPPEDLIVEDLARFEGQSDPGDEATIFALRSRDGATRGTYTVTFGTQMDTLDAAMVPRLKEGRKDH
ncbi:MAG TPA: hypothetical protein VFV75_19510 [Candidatus Polarisedimenticolaceae bacterium]|nr:hypothetical protein [Candidatus Polarisedimenticolaceae bacterium]